MTLARKILTVYELYCSYEVADKESLKSKLLLEVINELITDISIIDPKLAEQLKSDLF